MDRHSGFSPPQIIGNVSEFDDDGKLKRTGTVWTATAHIITAVIGAGVLTLAWGIAQLGWLIGIATVVIFACITLYTSNLLADCYRFPDSVTGKRNYTYMEAVKTILGGKMYVICGLVQHSCLAGFAIGYTITTSTSMVAIRKTDCYHKNRGDEGSCMFSNNPYMIGLGILEIFLSQIPSFHKLSWLSTVAAITSFGYSFIGIGLSLSTIIRGNGQKTSITGVSVGPDLSVADKTWNMMVALGNIALASTFAQILFDIQDTLRSSPPENKVMKKANTMGITVMTILFLLCGCSGYAAYGDKTPGNILTKGVREPFWLVDLGNLFIVVHLVGAYQVIIQPFYLAVETWAGMRWLDSKFVTKEHPVRFGKMKFSVNLFRLIWRTIFVILATILAMAMPFFNLMLGLLGAIGFWPLVVYFPLKMYITQNKIRKLTMPWFGLQMLNLSCLSVSLAAAVASIHGFGNALGKYKPFMYKE
ncbi:Amino acid permease [Quillaja saponaria]|uniref:Amino acid permease n=1 Tax=Quillaja saponaria TaxID=32244 RepID=A0AAD7LJ12_QUISA|nr:Amino acid permease [Quillaja saponaria]